MRKESYELLYISPYGVDEDEFWSAPGARRGDSAAGQAHREYLHQLESAIKSLMSDYARLAHLVVKAQEDNVSLRERVDQLEAQLDTTEGRVDRLDDDMSALRDDVDMLVEGE